MKKVEEEKKQNHERLLNSLTTLGNAKGVIESIRANMTSLSQTKNIRRVDYKVLMTENRRLIEIAEGYLRFSISELLKLFEMNEGEEENG